MISRAMLGLVFIASIDGGVMATPATGREGGSADAGAPESERALAHSALLAARHAVSQVDSGEQRRAHAATRLAEAETLFQATRYAEAARAADAAWQLVSEKAREPTRFSVAVDGAGRTHVSSSSGKAIRVEAEGVSQRVYPGQEVKVEKGQPPPAPQLVKVRPEPLVPADGARLMQTRSGKPLPIGLVWAEVPGARAFQVELTPAASAKGLTLRAARARTVLPAMPAGRYRWSVRAIYADGPGEPSVAREFELLDEPLKLEVGKTQWK